MITLESGDFGTYLLCSDDGQEILIQSDWDYPGIARLFGWNACHCGRTDGTVDCEHRTASEMIADAEEFLTSCIGDSVEDPGYFD